MTDIVRNSLLFDCFEWGQRMDMGGLPVVCVTTLRNLQLILLS